MDLASSPSVRHRATALLVVFLSVCGGEPDARAGAASRPDTPSASLPEAPAATEDAGRTERGSTIRITVLGTSLTAGMGLPSDELAWPARLEALAREAGFEVEVVNAGVSGDTSAGGLRRLRWVLRTEPDVLVVELGANDGLRGQDPDQLESNLREIIRRSREARPGIRIVLAGMRAPPNMGPGYTTRFDAVFPRVAREEDVALIPFLLDGVAGIAELNQEDGIHPTPEGHRIMARNAWEVLKPVLEKLEISR